MNYRHIYHAGNFADVFKHLVLTMVIGYLQNKDKGLFALDAFGGCGLYDLKSDMAQRTMEYEAGVGNFMNADFPNDDLKNFQDVLRPYYKADLYPGSPTLLADRLRPQDRLTANELHPEDYQTLRQNLSRYQNVKATRMDAYENIRAHIPPAERRGLVLIDPPFERKDEFEMLGEQLGEWAKRWPTGCYMIWYPIKANSNTPALFDAAVDLNLSRVWTSEFLMHRRGTPDSFNGSGLMIVNTPFQIPERIETLAPLLCDALGGLEITSNWLTAE